MTVKIDIKEHKKIFIDQYGNEVRPFTKTLVEDNKRVVRPANNEEAGEEIDGDQKE